MKNHNLFFEGKPVICVPVTGGRKEDILRKAASLAKQGVMMMEWRVDAFLEWKDKRQVCSLLKELKKTVGDMVLLATLRTAAEGGAAEISVDAYEDLLLAMADTKEADLLDMEFDSVREPEKMIRELQNRGVGVISSHHDFHKTPSREQMEDYLLRMSDAGADIAKLAVMPESISDLLSLLSATDTVRAKRQKKLFVTMSMGRLGALSRVTGEIFGSCITFGAAGERSAPGQVDLKMLEEILTLIHEIYGERLEENGTGKTETVTEKI